MDSDHYTQVPSVVEPCEIHRGSHYLYVLVYH